MAESEKKQTVKKESKQSSGARVTIEQYRSAAGRTKSIKGTIAALGLGSIGKKREIATNASVEGMLKTVAHLVRVID